MGYKASNNADTTLSESITQTSTTIAVATGRGDDFPALGATDWTLITITDKNGAREIIKIIARTGDTMTVGTTPGGEADVGGRAQEGTTALSITYTDDHSVRCCLTAGLIEAMADYSDQGDLTATPAEIEAVCKGNTATAAELSELHESGVVKADLEKLHDITLSASQINAFEALKNDFEALRTCFSGSSAPGNPVAGMWWYDTTANILKLRNEANNAWLDVYDFANQRAPLALLATNSTNCSKTVVAGTGITVTGSLTTGSSNVTVGIADGAVTASKLPSYTAGNYAEAYLGSVSVPASSGLETYDVATFRASRSGTVRMKGTFYRSGVVGGTVQVRKNGTGTGTTLTLNETPQALSTDVSVVAGDKLTFCFSIYTSGTGTAYGTDMGLCCGNPVLSAVEL